MNKLWWAFGIVVTVFCLCFTEISYTTATVTEVQQMVERAYKSFENGSTDTADELISKANNKWTKSQKIIDIFLFHDTVDNITISLITAQSTIKNSPDDFVTECKKTKEQLSSLKDAQLPYIENIL